MTFDIPDTYKRLRSSIDTLLPWLNQVHRTTGTRDMSDLQSKRIQVPTNVRTCLNNCVDILTDCVAGYAKHTDEEDAKEQGLQDEIASNHDALKAHLDPLVALKTMLDRIFR